MLSYLRLKVGLNCRILTDSCLTDNGPVSSLYARIKDNGDKPLFLLGNKPCYSNPRYLPSSRSWTTCGKKVKIQELTYMQCCQPSNQFRTSSAMQVSYKLCLKAYRICFTLYHLVRVGSDQAFLGLHPVIVFPPSAMEAIVKNLLSNNYGGFKGLQVGETHTCPAFARIRYGVFDSNVLRESCLPLL